MIAGSQLPWSINYENGRYKATHPEVITSSLVYTDFPLLEQSETYLDGKMIISEIDWCTYRGRITFIQMFLSAVNGENYMPLSPIGIRSELCDQWILGK